MMSPGNVIGNKISLIFALVSALAGFFSFKASILTLIVFAYGSGIIVFFLNILTTPKQNDIFSSLLTTDEQVSTYQKYHMYIRNTRNVSCCYSALLNALRIYCFIWCIVSLWKGFYFFGAISISYCFIFNSLIMKLDPVLHVMKNAERGIEKAMFESDLIKSVIHEWGVFDENRRRE
tara:strand:- start:60 stop:590 length:531 start_codon:yes stop_codon:yes gene_type:complete